MLHTLPTILLQTSSLQLFVDKVSSGFGVTPLQAAGAGAVVAGFFTFLIWYSRRQKRIEEERHYQRSEEMYREACRRKSLTPEDEELLERLSRYLAPPLHKLELLSNARLFERCARSLRGQEGVSEERLAALRKKIGLRPAGPEEIPKATGELPALLPLHISARGTRFSGHIAEESSQQLLVHLPMENARAASAYLEQGEQVKVFFQLPTGVYSFSTRVVRCRGSEVELQHAGELRREQRRRYFRRKLRLPVFVTSPSTGGVPAASTMYDLGGGGASLRNPRNLVKPEEEIELSFAPERERLHISARVVRVSHKGRMLHTAFTSIPEAARDRIIGSLHLHSAASRSESRSSE